MSKLAPKIGWGFALVLVSLFVGRVIAQDTEDPPKQPPPVLAELEERVARLEALLGEPRAGQPSVTLRLTAMQNSIEAVEAEVEEAERHGESIEAIEDDLSALTRRLERLDRNEVEGMKREIAELERAVDDLKSRVRRLE